MSCLTQIDLEHVLHSMMMPLPGVATFLLYLASFRSDSCVRRSIFSTSSVPLFSIYLIKKSMLSHYYDKKGSKCIYLA